MTIIDDLKRMQEETILRGFDMQEMAPRFNNLRTRYQDGTAPRAVAAFNLFQTPKHLAARMAELIPEKATKILEPSAGLGRVYHAIRARKPLAHITMVENAPGCCRELYEITEEDENSSLKQSDFLEVAPTFYDVVIMNPPFKQGRDIKHIKHALEFLHTGGLLIALCYNGKRQNKILKPLSSSWEVLPPGTFKESGTSADVVLLTINKRVQNDKR